MLTSSHWGTPSGLEGNSPGKFQTPPSCGKKGGATQVVPDSSEVGWVGGIMVDVQAFPWYAVRLRSNFERRATDILNEKGLPTFLPLNRTRRTWSDRVKEIDVPLFSGYTFCKFDGVTR